MFKGNKAHKDKLDKLWCGMINRLFAEETKAFPPDLFFFTPHISFKFFFLFLYISKFTQCLRTFCCAERLKCSLRKCVDKPSCVPFSPL